MPEITGPRILWLKGGLFLLAGMMAATLLLLDQSTPRTLALLAITIWSFSRAYYFAFYVVERYVDPAYRFAGLVAFARYTLSRRDE